MNEPKIQALTRGKEPKRNICPNAKVHGRERSNHQPSLVAVNEATRITWDSTVFLEKELKHNQSHITGMYQDTREWSLIDTALSADQNIIRAEKEKVKKYNSKSKNSSSIKSDSGNYRALCTISNRDLVLEAR